MTARACAATRHARTRAARVAIRFFSRKRFSRRRPVRRAHPGSIAGFELVAKSEINANPKDTKDYPKGVWTLPPNYAEGDKDRAKYEAIGESDRMTLRFVKPLK